MYLFLSLFSFYVDDHRRWYISCRFLAGQRDYRLAIYSEIFPNIRVAVPTRILCSIRVFSSE